MATLILLENLAVQIYEEARTVKHKTVIKFHKKHELT